jgi:hypothetical protein
MELVDSVRVGIIRVVGTNVALYVNTPLLINTSNVVAFDSVFDAPAI